MPSWKTTPSRSVALSIGFANADAETTLPAKVPANIKDIKLLREASHRR